MRIFKLKQEVITRATRQNKQITLPRVIQLLETDAGYTWTEAGIDITPEHWETHGWARLIGDLYDEEDNDG